VLRPMIRKMFDWNQDLVWFLCHLTSFVDVFFFTFINYIVFYIILFFVALSLIHFGK
jgi:phage shock protein PspC (stress-responsive transcriptional regulator)